MAASVNAVRFMEASVVRIKRVVECRRRVSEALAIGPQLSPLLVGARAQRSPSRPRPVTVQTIRHSTLNKCQRKRKPEPRVRPKKAADRVTGPQAAPV